jgi:hypothetical protein
MEGTMSTVDTNPGRTDKAWRRHRLRRGLVRGVAGLGALLVVAGFVAPSGVAAAAQGGANVLPPTATPSGFSLADMARLVGQFTTSGNDPAYLPATPFQLLYTDGDNVTFVPATSDGGDCGARPNLPCGLLATQKPGVVLANSFGVPAGTSFYVPILNADDSPPVVGNFPTSSAGTKAYVFGPDQLGGRGFSVCIDGDCVALGSGYAAGPETTPPLLDGGGTHIITIGAFLTPMRPGSHVVRIRGGWHGAGIAATYGGLPFLDVDFTYAVTVLR